MVRDVTHGLQPGLEVGLALTVPPQPAVRVEVVGVGPEDIVVAVRDGRVDAYLGAPGDEPPVGEGEALGRYL